MIRWHAAGPVRGRLLDARRRRQRRAVRLAQPRPDDGDDAERVDENRRRLCAEVGADPDRLALNRQLHSASSTAPSPARGASPATGSGRTSPDLPVLAMSADCLPIALARVGDGRAGRRGPARGVARPSGGHRRGGRRRARRAVRTRRSGPRSARAATRSAPRSRSPSREASGRTCSRAGTSTSGPQPSGRCARPASRRSSGSTSARRATRSSSSRTAAPASRAACRE